MCTIDHRFYDFHLNQFLNDIDRLAERRPTALVVRGCVSAKDPTQQTAASVGVASIDPSSRAGAAPVVAVAANSLVAGAARG